MIQERVQTARFGEVILDLVQSSGDKCYDVFIPGEEDALGNEFIGTVSYSPDLNTVIEEIDLTL